MSDQEPVCACVAETNSDAHLIATFLNDHGITAHAVEDNSPAGMFSLGTLPELYRPEEGSEAAERESYGENGTLADFRSLKKPLATAMFAPFLFFSFLFIMMAIRGCPGRY